MFLKKLIASLICLITFSNLQLYSQTSDSLFDISCQHEDLVILSENMKVRITGKKTYLMIATVSNEITYIIKKPNGLDEFSPMVLPKNFDELFIHHAPTVRNIDWSYENIQVRKFEVQKLSENSSPKEISAEKGIKEKRVINMKGFFGNINEHEYYIKDIEVGDTIKITYIYDIPFKENWIKLLSNRLFFHGKYPKKSFTLSWCYNKNLEVDSVFYNHENPGLIIDGNNFCYNWNYNNLPGCLDEPGSRPYKSVPYFVFVPQSYDFEYTHYNSYVQEFIPPYFLESFKREDELQVEFWDNVIGNKNKNNLKYKKVADRLSAMAGADTLGFGKMRFFQQYMVDSVTYNPSIEYYSHNEDQIIQRAGVDLLGRMVRDNNIERVYGNIIHKFDLNLFTAYPVDIRSGEISPQYNSTVKDNDMLFAVILKDNTVGYVVPRSDKNYYYFEELPFYYEEIPVLLLHSYDFPSRLDKRNFNTEFRSLITPTSRWKDNYRKVQSKVKISMESGTLDFQTRIILSGQYSTLTRNLYMERPNDSTINQRYYDPIWNIKEDVTVSKVETKHPDIFYPFKTTISTNYSTKLSITDGNTLTLNPGSWFKLVYWENVSNGHRFLDYYPDFVGSDTYTYMLEFDEPVLMEAETDTINITNQYGHLSLQIQQMSDTQVILNCKYSILSKVVRSDDIDLVEQVNQAIQELNQKKLVIRRIE